MNHSYLKTEKIVFYYQSCPEKKSPCDQDNLLKLEAEGQEFAKILRSLEQFNQTVKGQNNLL